MILKWIYNTWRYFWTLVISLGVTILVFAVLVWGALQLNPVQRYIADSIENNFNSLYNSELQIGELSGRLPFQVVLQDIQLNYQHNDVIEEVFSVESVSIQISIQDLLRREFTISSAVLNQPHLNLTFYEDEESNNLLNAFRANDEEDPIDLEENSERSEIRIPRFRVSRFVVTNGNGLVKLNGRDVGLDLPDEFFFENLNTSVSLELSPERQFFNLSNFVFQTPQLKNKDWQFRGQIYADDRFFELNRITFRSNESLFRFNLEIDGIHLVRENIREQLENATYRFRINDMNINPQEFSDIMPVLEPYLLPISVELNAEGSMTEAELSRLDVQFGDSRALLNGMVQHPFDLEIISYSAEIEFLNAHTNDLKMMSLLDETFLFEELGELTVRGFLNGDFNEFETRWDIFSPSGEVNLLGVINISEELPAYNLSLVLDEIDLSIYSSLGLSKALINGDLNLEGQGTDYRSATASVTLDFTNSFVEDLNIEKLLLEGVIDEGFFEPSFNLYAGEGSFSGTGWMDLLLDEPILNFSGEANTIDFAQVYSFGDFESSEFNFRYNLVTQGFTLDSFHGDFYFDFRDSKINDQEIDEFELIFALSPPTDENRLLTIGGTWLELELSGDIVPSQMIESYEYWLWETKSKIKNRTIYLHELPLRPATLGDHVFDLNLDLKAQIDDLTTLNQFFAQIPSLDTITNINLSYRSTDEEFEIAGNISSDFFIVDDFKADSLVVDIYSSIRKNQNFGFHETIIDLSAGLLEISNTNLRDNRIRINMYDEAVVLEEFEATVGNDVRLGSQITGVFTERGADIRVLEFFVGDESYNWQNISETPIRIDTSGHIIFDRLEFGNIDERIVIDGTLSEQIDDEVVVELQDFQLIKISDIVDGEIKFEGRLNGMFTTSTLRTNPFLSGKLVTNELRLDDRLIGDIEFESSYDNLQELFNIDLRILTDPQVYADYLAGNQEIGQDIHIIGFIQPSGSESGSILVDLDIDFQEIDLWILPFIVQDIFTELEGRASGEGKFIYDDDGIGYDAKFTVHDVALRPVFLNSLLILNGDVLLNNDQGVVLNDVRISDNSGGTGVLSGDIDLNDFQRESFLNIQLSMNRLRFIDNSYSPDTPFYGRAFGTGIVRMTGTNFSPFLSTPEPISLTSNSVISILAEEEGFSEEAIRFIEFVDSFDEPTITEEIETESNDNNDVDLTFIEQFQLDLRFVANQNMTVRLVFDNVTNEVLTARGTGNIRLLLQDQEFQVFGRFDVSGGDYNFVGGDIFVRRFSIRDGGTINWDGDPINARINVLASYRARPDIRPLRPDLADDQIQRVAVDLILVIGGTIDAIENDFFFELPTGVDASQTAAILGIINSEEQKLLQATTILFTNSFYPVDTDTRDTGSLQTRAGQVGIGTLLSSQINTLLNSNVSNLDIDLNLTGFDQADLGIALRLFDDRLTLRREGLITGEDANLGDFDVTFQINRYLSVQAFHRRDPFLSGLASASRGQFETINGLGLDARIQFNTWGELGRRINPFKRSVSPVNDNED